MTKEEAIQRSESINGLTSLQEKETMWDLAMKFIPENGLAIEVGTWTGGSAVIIGEVCRKKNARLICIDAFSADMHSAANGVAPSAFQSVVENCEGLPIDYMAGDSVYFKDYLKHGIADFIFVDGDHHYPRVKEDIEGYWNMLKKGGCYLLHDVMNPCDVKEVADNFFGKNKLTIADSAGYIIK